MGKDYHSLLLGTLGETGVQEEDGPAWSIPGEQQQLWPSICPFSVLSISSATMQLDSKDCPPQPRSCLVCPDSASCLKF